MAEHVDDVFLLYLIHMAILEAERQAHYGDAKVGGPVRPRQYLELNGAGEPDVSVAGYSRSSAQLSETPSASICAATMDQK